jgi:hypothetical protein
MSGISRLRPILITSITTIIAMLPLALGEAEYVLSIGQPFAVTVMGGLAFATLLTLFYIPTMSAGLESVLGWFRNLKPSIKAIQIILLIVTSILISSNIDGLLVQMIAYIGAVILIPGGTHFIMTSLRQANAKMVAPGEAMQIKFQRLTKVYGRDKRWIREWKGNKNLFTMRGEEPVTTRNVLQDLIWQSSLIAFLVYFIYFHLDKAFWQLIFMIALHALLLSIFKNVSQLLTRNRKLKSHQENKEPVMENEVKQSRFSKLKSRLLRPFLPRHGESFFMRTSYKLLYWGFPIFSAIYLYNDVQIKAFAIILNFLWFTGLYLARVSKRLNENKVDVQATTGWFKKIRRLYYKLLLSIPFVKPKPAEFKALKGASLTIEHGMCGLLGPNGAG